MPSDIGKSRSRTPSTRAVDTHEPNDWQVVVQWSELDRCYVVTIPAWQNVQTHGATMEEAVANAQEVLTLLLSTARKHGDPIPPPQRRHSGNLRLPFAVSVHGRLAREAEREGVSLNQWIVTKLAG